MSPKDRVAFIFPGQGVHRPEMLDYAASLPTWGVVHSALIEATGIDPVQKAIEEGTIALNRNEISSLLTVSISIACLQQLLDSGISCDYMAGYSVGQYTALYGAGVLSIREVLSLVRDRALLMDQTRAGTDGTMIAVIGLSDTIVSEICQQISTSEHPVSVANYNSPGQLTVAGTLKGIADVIPVLREQKPLRITPLSVSGAWHCELLRPAIPDLLARINKIPLELPSIPVVDNTTASYLPLDIESLKQKLTNHMISPVYWRQSIDNLISDGVDQFVEVGFGDMLTKFGFFINRGKSHLSWEKLV